MVAGTSVTRNSTGLLAVGSDSAVTIPATPLTAVGTITSTYAVNALQVSTAFTLECWYKPTQVTAEVIVVAYGPDATTTPYGLGITSSGYAWSVLQLTSGQQYPTPANNQALVAGKSYHIAVTYDTTTGYCITYVNGAEIALTAYSTGLNITGYASPGAFTIGNFPDFGEAVNSSGVVDEVAVYPKALSAATILSHYTNGLVAAGLFQVGSGAFSATGFSCELPFFAPNLGDTLLIGISTYNAGAVTTPAGWTLLKSGVNGTENLYVYGKISAGTESSVTITATTPHGNWAYCEFSNGPALISSLVAGTAGTASASATTSTTTVVPTTATGTVVSFHGARSTSALTTMTDTSTQLTAQAALAATTSFGSIAVTYSQAALPASTYTEYGVWNASCTSMVDIQVWIPSTPAAFSSFVPYQNYQRAAILAQ